MAPVHCPSLSGGRHRDLGLASRGDEGLAKPVAVVFALAGAKVTVTAGQPGARRAGMSPGSLVGRRREASPPSAALRGADLTARAR